MYLNPIIYNITLTNAGTEYSQTLPENTRKVLIRVRSGASDLKLAYTSGESGTKYITIPAGSSKYLEGIYIKGETLYFQSPTASEVVEIEAWTD